jgi:hypothetical protein
VSGRRPRPVTFRTYVQEDQEAQGQTAPFQGQPRQAPQYGAGLNSLRQLVVADDPSRWRALGLRGITSHDGRWHLAAGEVTVTVDPECPHGASGIVAWGLDHDVESVPDLGVRFVVADTEVGAADRPLLGVDHVVLMTSSLEATCALIDMHLGAPLKRVREVGNGVRQGFHRLGDVIVEVVETPEVPPGPPRCWGLVFTVDDLDALVSGWSDEVVSAPRPAVQPGRRIASLRRGAGLATAVAFMTPHRSVDSPG